MKCIVKAGKELTHGVDNGQGGAVQRVHREGEVVDLPATIAHEVRHLVDALDATGKPKPIGAPDAAAVLRADLEKAKPHERISILQAARSTVAGDLKDIDDQIGAEQKRLAADEKKVGKAEAPKTDATKA